MEAIILVLGVFVLVISSLTYVYLLETKRLRPHIPPRYIQNQAHKGNFWDSETQMFYKWHQIEELKKIREVKK